METSPLDPVVARDRVLSPWQRTRALLALDRSDIWLCIVYGIGIGLLTLVTPAAVQALVNTVSFGSVMQPLVVLTVLVAIGLAFAGMLRAFQAYVVEALQERMLVRGVLDLSHRLVHAEPAALARVHPPELVQRFFELPTLQKSAAAVLVDGIDLALRLLVGLPLLAAYHPLLLVFALLLLGSIAITVFVLGRGALVSAIGESTAKYEAASWLEHLARMPATFRGTAARADAACRAELVATRYRDARRAHFRRLVRHLFGGVAIKVVGATLLLGLGGALVIGNQLTLGQLVAAELVFAAIGAAMLKLYKQLEAVYDLATSAHKMGALLDLPLERAGGEPLAGEGPAGIALRDVTLEVGGRPIIAHATLAIPAGDRLLLDGDGGCGKSTLLDALAADLAVANGVIEIDGVDLRIADLGDARRAVVLVREPEVAATTVLANLRLGGRDTGVREIDELLRVLSLDEPITRLPDGLVTQLLPTGRPLSRSQVKRLVLARALLARPRVLLLDGALDGLGLAPAARDRLLDHVLAPSAPWTVILTTTDPAVRERVLRVATIRDTHLEVR